MPNTPSAPSSVYIQSGSPDTLNVSLGAQTVPGSSRTYAPGELGLTIDRNDKTYTLVVVDSGCTSAAPAGQVLANQILYWKSKTQRVVTNDSRFAQNTNTAPTGPVANAFRNMVAGIARVAVGVPGAGGNYIAMLVRGAGILIQSDGAGGAGDIAIASSSTTLPQVTNVAAGTASTYVRVGVIQGAASGGFIAVDVDLTSLP